MTNNLWANRMLVRNISKNINTAVTMTRNYLDLARIEKGELRVDRKGFDMIGDVIDPILEELKQALIEKDMTVAKDLPGAIPVEGDPALLYVAYKNLINNALKYGNRGGKIGLGFNQNKTYLRFEIWNEGKGLLPDQVSRLFQRFVRFSNNSETSRSTGLGLFITKEIISKHGGDIWAESETGEWINFIFTLPR